MNSLLILLITLVVIWGLFYLSKKNIISTNTQGVMSVLTLSIQIFALIMFAGCAVTAAKVGDTMILKGFGAKKAAWPEGFSLEKNEPFSVPDIRMDK